MLDEMWIMNDGSPIPDDYYQNRAKQDVQRMLSIWGENAPSQEEIDEMLHLRDQMFYEYQKSPDYLQLALLESIDQQICRGIESNPIARMFAISGAIELGNDSLVSHLMKFNCVHDIDDGEDELIH